MFWNKKNNRLRLSISNNNFINVSVNNFFYINCTNGENGDMPTELTVKDILEVSEEYNKLNKLIDDKKDHLLFFTENIDLVNAIGTTTFGPTKVIISKFDNKSGIEKKSSALGNDIALSFLISHSIFKKIQKKNIVLTEDHILIIKSTRITE